MLRLIVAILFAFPIAASTFRADDGVTLHYDRIGRGDPVILLSGGPGFSPAYLEPIARQLSESRTFILLHQRGTGRSVIETYDATTLPLALLVADVDALRRHLELEKVTLVAHSWGGILSMMYTSAHPDRVLALALIDSGGPTLASVPKFAANLDARLNEEDRGRIAEWSTPAALAADRRKAMLELTKARAAAYFADRSKSVLLTEGMTPESFHEGVFWALTGQMVMGMDLREGLKQVKVPTLVIHGRQDPLESAEEVHRAIAGSELRLIEDAGHFPWLEQPDEFYRILGEFLKVPAIADCH